MTARGSR